VTRTLTLSTPDEDGSAERPLLAGPQLVLALDCADLRARPARFALADLDEVRIGRGSQRRRVRREESGKRILEIEVPDGFMSSRHVRLERSDEGWRAHDEGSKNGTLLGEEALTSASLRDGSILTTGHTIFVYRQSLPFDPGSSDVDLSGVGERAGPMATLNEPFARAIERCRRVAASPVPMLICGETGTGKELMARAIHEAGGRSGSFVAVNCGALPTTLLISELFGARRGAYSGATGNRTGLVRSADQGTLFLDEIAELPLESQSVFLRVLQEGEVLPVGADEPVPVDVKVIAATHQDLSARVADGTFRADLFARVAGYRVDLPALRERQEDFGLVLGTLLARQGASVTIEPAAARALLRYHWPRNIRELEHTLAAAVAMAAGSRVTLDHLPDLDRSVPAETPAAGADGVDREALSALLATHRGNVSAVARALGTSRSQVRRLVARFELDLESFRDG